MPAARRLALAQPVDLALLAAFALLGIVAALATSGLHPYDAPEVDPRPVLLPLYLFRSLARLVLAYAAAVLLALATGHLASRSAFARRLILPTLDVLQSVPILGFFPAAVAVFIGVFGGTALVWRPPPSSWSLPRCSGTWPSASTRA
jgi:NitT/TauT family transport system permease protein